MKVREAIKILETLPPDYELYATVESERQHWGKWFYPVAYKVKGNQKEYVEPTIKK